MDRLLVVSIRKKEAKVRRITNAAYLIDRMVF
jgi:hypothetical protein